MKQAYHSAQWQAGQATPLIVGWRISLSNNHTTLKNGKPTPFRDMCDDLVGEYPKDFKFTGWHPQCRCVMTPILATPAERKSLYRSIFENGTTTPPPRPLPNNFKQWLQNNKQRLGRAKTPPLFLQQNKNVINKTNLDPKRIFKLWNEDKLKKEIALTNISQEELRSIDGDLGGAYTKTGASWDINATLRSGKNDSLNSKQIETIEALDRVIARNKLKEDMMCYRYDSIKFAKHLAGRQKIGKENLLDLFKSLEGQIIEDKGFRSLSTVEGLNAFPHYPIRLNIRVKAGTPAYVADNFSESEIVLGRGTKIKVLSSREEDSKIIVECELL